MNIKSILKMIPVIISAIAGFLASLFLAQKKKVDYENKDLLQKNEELKKENNEAADIINRMQTVTEEREKAKNEKQEKIDKVYSGSSADSFSASIDLLHNSASRKRQ